MKSSLIVIILSLSLVISFSISYAATGDFTSINGTDNGIESVSEIEDHFGASLAAGDFNGDGYDDIAIGVPDEDLYSFYDAGSVEIIYGSWNGMASDGAQLWYQVNIGGNSEPGDRFGTTLTTGDFNSDGYDDLAIGVPKEDIFLNGINILDAGVVNIMFGSSSGLTSDGAQVWNQSQIGGNAEEFDYFGTSLTVADFNGDRYDDLAVGAPGEDVYTFYNVNHRDAGSINIIFGSSSGLTSDGAQVWDQETPGIWGFNDPGDNFGASLAAGSFDGGRPFQDLAVGVPNEDVLSYSIRDGGAVNVIYGNNLGLGSWRSDFITQEEHSFIMDD